MKKVVYVDMDNVLVNFQSGIDQLPENIKAEYKGRYDEVEGIFSLMEPVNGAIESVLALCEKYEVYVLSTAPWNNPSAWSDKLLWIQKYFGKGEENPLYKRVILSHNKNMNIGDYLIDDRTKNGAGEFQGDLVLFGSKEYPNWNAVCKYLGV
jgi:putative 5'(3')-deoxyribonucleotidase|nr:MAG TPA: hypothetical protein [Caudoviricetes sp.]